MTPLHVDWERWKVKMAPYFKYHSGSWEYTDKGVNLVDTHVSCFRSGSGGSTYSYMAGYFTEIQGKNRRQFCRLRIKHWTEQERNLCWIDKILRLVKESVCGWLMVNISCQIPGLGGISAVRIFAE